MSAPHPIARRVNLRHRLLLLLIMISMLALVKAADSFAQNTSKGAKVVEVESYLSDRALAFIKGRFPALPVLVSVKVTPLRHDTGPAASGTEGKINLPFYASPDVENLDAWDDPMRSVHDLIPRIQFVEMVVALPTVVPADEITELKEALYANLGLIPGRDNIKFDLKPWVKRENDPMIKPEMAIMVGGVVILFLMGLLAILRYSSLILRQGFLDAATKSSAAANQSAAPAQAMKPMESESHEEEKFGGDSIQINDPLRISDKLVDLVKKLEADAGFPNLDDMLEFEDLVASNAGGFGTILQEMSDNTQQALFMRSSSQEWLEAFNLTSPVDMPTYQALLRICLRKRVANQKKWQDLLIGVWRLGAGASAFLEKLDQRDALNILAWMPTNISIPVARHSFPGGWGILLKPDFHPAPFKDELTDKFLAQVLSVKPYNDVGMLDRYKHERGLLKYLRTCTMELERDIYSAAKEGSTLRVVRPPFYAIFSGEKEDLQKLVDQISLEDWGFAILNVDRTVRQPILNLFQDKRKFMLFELIKVNDQRGVKANEIGIRREKIARVYDSILQSKKASTKGRPSQDKPAADKPVAEKPAAPVAPAA